MKVREMIKIQNIVALFVMAALAFLVLRTTAGASQDGRPQGRGRMVPRQFEPQPAQSLEMQPIVIDEDARAALAGIEKVQLQTNSHLNTRHIRFDVAENGKRFTPDETPVFLDGVPAYGAEFITEGYIYPEGTLNGSNGVKADGSPEFPNQVIGRWYCRGWHVGEGGHTTKGPWVVTHQLYDFGTEAGRSTITTDGLETPEENVPIQRAIIGGTGGFALARGEARQTFLGFNSSNGVSLRYELRVMTR